jgi:hypothetical protein
VVDRPFEQHEAVYTPLAASEPAELAGVDQLVTGLNWRHPRGVSLVHEASARDALGEAHFGAYEATLVPSTDVRPHMVHSYALEAEAAAAAAAVEAAAAAAAKAEAAKAAGGALPPLRSSPAKSSPAKGSATPPAPPASSGGTAGSAPPSSTELGTLLLLLGRASRASAPLRKLAEEAYKHAVGAIQEAADAQKELEALAAGKRAGLTRGAYSPRASWVPGCPLLMVACALCVCVCAE